MKKTLEFFWAVGCTAEAILALCFFVIASPVIAVFLFIERIKGLPLDEAKEKDSIIYRGKL